MIVRRGSTFLASAAGAAVLLGAPSAGVAGPAWPAHAANESTAPAPPTAVRPRAVAASLRSTIDPNSRIRRGPHLNSPIVYTTRVLTSVDIRCYAVGDRFNDGHYNTNIWYYLTAHPGRRTVTGYSWGGKVNTRRDPPPGLRRC